MDAFTFHAFLLVLLALYILNGLVMAGGGREPDHYKYVCILQAVMTVCITGIILFID